MYEVRRTLGNSLVHVVMIVRKRIPPNYSKTIIKEHYAVSKYVFDTT